MSFRSQRGPISTLNFSRFSRAKLLPGLLYSGSQASTDLYRYRSRMGEMTGYSSILRVMRALSKHEAAVTLAYGIDPSALGVYQMDTFQKFEVHCDPAIGRENKVNIGLATTYYEIDLDFRLGSEEDNATQLIS